MGPYPRPFFLSPLSFLFAAGLLAAGGCAKHGGTISFEASDHSHTSLQRFSQAYIAQTKTSEIEVVLTDTPTDWQKKQTRKNQPIQPISLPPLRHVMRIHMYWRPMTLTAKNPAAINASVDWYVIGPEGSNDVLVYEGAAFVVLEGRGDTRRVRIKDGQITPKFNSSEGRLLDPVGPSKMSGSVVAKLSSARVDDVLTETAQYAKMAKK